MTGPDSSSPAAERPRTWSRTHLRLLGLVVAIVLADTAWRFHVEFEVQRVLELEAPLFFSGGLGALALGLSARRRSILESRPAFWLALFLGLGALRAGLWAAGTDVLTANIVIGIIGLPSALALHRSITRALTGPARSAAPERRPS